jgi:hypothetical protein
MGQITVENMRAAFANGLEHPPGMVIKGSSTRIGAFVKILQDTGRLPVPPVFLRKSGGLEILDGCHRIAALLHVQAAGAPTTAHNLWIASHSDADSLWV